MTIRIQIAEYDPVRHEKGKVAEKADAIYQHVKPGMNATLPQMPGIDVGEGPENGKDKLCSSVSTLCLIKTYSLRARMLRS